MKIDLQALLDAGGSLVVLVGGLAAGYWGLRRWVQRAAKEAQAVNEQLKTSNGTTVAGYVEQTAQQITEMRAELAAQRDTATMAHALARSAHDRLDAHLIGHNSTP